MASAAEPFAPSTTAALTPLLALASAPVVWPLNFALQQPAVRDAVKAGLMVSARCQESTAELAEQFEDLMAEARAEMVAPWQEDDGQVYRNEGSGTSRVAEDICAIATDLNHLTLSLTQGWIDLPTLAAFGLGGLALRQLVTRGGQLDALPWYVLAWYGFDSFVKLHGSGQPAGASP